MTARTLFEKTKLPLTIWFLAIFLLTQNKLSWVMAWCDPGLTNKLAQSPEADHVLFHARLCSSYPGGARAVTVVMGAAPFHVLRAIPKSASPSDAPRRAACSALALSA